MIISNSNFSYSTGNEEREPNLLEIVSWFDPESGKDTEIPPCMGKLTA